VEHLDFGHFSGPQYEDHLRAYLRGKYRESPINVIVAAGPRALEFALHVRGDLGNDVPVVFSIVDDATLARLRPSNATGKILQYNLRDQLVSARALVPDLKHVALVGDRLETQSFLREFRRELSIFSEQLDFIDLTGLAMADVKARVATLPENSAIVYTAINVDGAGVSFIPRDALVAIAEVANQPIVVDSETMIGYGGAGGFVASPTFIAEATALLALRVLNGQTPSMIPPAADELKPVFDWRQLKRWHVSEDRLPPGSEVRFREITAWERYKSQIILIVLALLLQAALIGLIIEHWRRRRAEEATRQSLSESLRLEALRAAHDRQVQAEKLASLGELTAGIAQFPQTSETVNVRGSTPQRRMPPIGSGKLVSGCQVSVSFGSIATELGCARRPLKAAGKVRITGQLIDAITGAHICLLRSHENELFARTQLLLGVGESRFEHFANRLPRAAVELN
jgi:ABC-type uncharacterized transport system substrate-binding protein